MIKVGIIGYNEGNGHPYSFSAIINGYDENRMKISSYPVIYDYLSKQSKEDFRVGSFKVTHIWTPYPDISREIADCCFIEHLVNNYWDMATEVDAVIIARDDVDSHYEIARFFLEKGKYVFVDKPLSLDLNQLEYFKPFLEKAKLMSCSGLRYMPQIENRFDGELVFDDICFVNTISVLDWKKYGIHALEAITPIMGSKIINIVRMDDPLNKLVKIEYENQKYALIQINKNMFNGIQASFYTNKKIFFIKFNNNFACFKKMLQEFHRMIISNKPVISPDETISILKVIREGDTNER